MQPGPTVGSPRNWYAGLDGIRAIAVFLVFTVHYLGAKTYTAGWIGVLMFFVLSGFLITGILYDNQNEPYRFRNFYIRRTLRIFPLFYLAWILVLVAAYFLGGHWKPVQILWLAYLGNFARFIAGSELPDHIYTFKGSGLTLEIGHFWSLAVEEQFYLIWPLIVFRIRDRRKLIRICLFTILTVPILRFVLWKSMPESMLSMEFLYRMTFTQCDGFLLGGLVALWLRGPEKDRVLRHANTFLWASLGLLIMAYLANNHFHPRNLSATSGWMSTYGFSLVDLVAASLILCSLRASSPVSHVMTLSPLRFLGKYSYGFYVYHVPLMPFLHHYLEPVRRSLPARAYYIGGLLSVVVYFLVILFVSVCSYHVVEAPFLRMKDRFTVRHRNPGTQSLNTTG